MNKDIEYYLQMQGVRCTREEYNAQIGRLCQEDGVDRNDITIVHPIFLQFLRENQCAS